jgi:tetratricopeptide (TPR) repeat protein
MSSGKIIAIIIVGALALAGCGSRPPAAVAPSKSRAPRFEPFDVPQQVDAASVQGLEQALYLMPSGHPDRLALRDRIAGYRAGIFAGIAEDRPRERLEVFVEGLALHDPGDFVPGGVSPALAPMARWIAGRYARRGEEPIVLASLRYLMLAEPEEPSHAEHYRDLAAWSERVRGTIEDDLERLGSVKRNYLRMALLVPDREIVDRVADVILEHHQTLMTRIDRFDREAGGLPPFVLRGLLREGGSGKDLIYVYFLAGRVEAALDKIRRHPAGLELAGEYAELLEDLAAGRNVGEGYFALAGRIGADDPRAGLRACVLARAADPADPRFALCAGKFFERLGRHESAIDLYAAAAETAPDEELMGQILEMVRTAMYELHHREAAQGSRRVAKIADRIVERALEPEPEKDSDVRMAAAALLFTAGEIEFDDGLVGAAMRHFERSSEIWPGFVVALLKIAEIQHLRGRDREAVATLDRALGLGNDGDGGLPDYWKAILLERRGDSRSALGEDGGADMDWEQALVAWKAAAIPPSQEPEAALRQGVLFDRLGQIPASTEAFRRAIRLDPNRRATYAELLSFLVVRGRLEEARTFYRLAFNQDRIEVMWKIYYSLWVEGLALRKEGRSFAIARGYLEQSDGASWQDELARFFTGRIDAAQLRERASNTGQRVEVDYYVAVELLGVGRKEEARALLDRVIASDLMGFFEYRMARALLATEF